MESRGKNSYLNRFVRAKSCNDRANEAPKNDNNTLNGLDAREFYEELVREENAAIAKSRSSETSTKHRRKKERLHGKRTSLSFSDGKLENDLDTETGINCRSSERLRFKRGYEKEFQIKNSLFRAITEGDLKRIQEILSTDRDFLYIEDQYGWNPLMCAIAGGHVELVKYLVQQDENILDKRDFVGRNAWDIAIRFKNNEIIDLMLNTKVKKENDVIEDKSGNQNNHKESSEIVHHYCEVCSNQIISNDVKKHDISMSHLFNLYKEKVPPTTYHIENSNIGYRMLKDAGWSEEKGLGSKENGQQQPVPTYLKNDRSGLGLDRRMRKRVTHFKANDDEAVQQSGNTQRGRLKKEKLKLKIKSKQWERNIRRYMNSD